MDLQAVKDGITVNVYHIDASRKVPLHQHPKHDEIFYCIKGAGYGLLQDGRVDLTVGKAFIVPAGTMHSVGSDHEIFVSSFLVPVVDAERG